MKRRKATALFMVLALGAGLFSANGANAALTLTLGGNGVYDTDLNITWLANANLADTQSFGVSGINANGSMNWNTVQSWIGAMNADNYLGYNDWRLPTTTDIGNNGFSGNGYDGTGDYGYNVTSSEMGHLYYKELGNLGYRSTAGGYYTLGWGLTNTGPFTNVQTDRYWSGTEYAPDTYAVWDFNMYSGNQLAGYKYGNLFAWAVRPGNSIPAVPETEAYAMLLTGFGLLGFTACRRKNRAA